MKKRKTSGSALLLTLWAIIVVSIAVTGLVTIIQSDQEESGAVQHGFLARQLAESAVAIASHPRLGPYDPIFAEATNMGGKCVTTMRAENGRLDINYVIEKKRTDILAQLFANWGLDPGAASDLVESLRQWTQADPLELMRQDQSAYYEQKLGSAKAVPHRPFQSVDEMALVQGMDALAAKKPDWRNYFTVWTAGRLNLNEASPELIAAVLGDQRAQIAALVQQREKMRTSLNEDEAAWYKLEEPLRILGVAGDSPAASFFTVKSGVWRIEARATVGTRSSLVGVVVKKDALPVRTLCRYEQ